MIKKKGDRQHTDFLELLASETNLKFTDTHAHIHFKPLSDDVDTLLANCKANKVERVVTVGITLEDSINAVKLAEKHDSLYAVAGVHPHDSADFQFSQLSEFEKLFNHEKVLAIGEIGLDFFRNHSPKDVQEKVFLTFMDMAIALNKPIIIHNRDATESTIKAMQSMVAGRENNGIIHCFSGDKDLLRWALDNNFYISFAGPLTYPKAAELHETVKYVPLDRLFIETDCPYLTPTPFRGKTNEPANVVYTALMMSELLNVDIIKLTEQLETNFLTLFSGAK